jgi:hypothetical protein
MAVIHHTTLVPGKLELLTGWLPSQHWYAAHAAAPSLAKVGGFRLDDPAGEVGIELMVVRDDAARPAHAYLVPMTYRGSPLAGAEECLIGMAEHGVLGKRWIYDGTQDPVLLDQLVGLVQGRVQAQAQSQTNTPDATVEVARVEADQPLSVTFSRLLVPADPFTAAKAGQVSGLWTASDGALVRSVFATANPASG